MVRDGCGRRGLGPSQIPCRGGGLPLNFPVQPSPRSTHGRGSLDQGRAAASRLPGRPAAPVSTRQCSSSSPHAAAGLSAWAQGRPSGEPPGGVQAPRRRRVTPGLTARREAADGAESMSCTINQVRQAGSPARAVGRASERGQGADASSTSQLAPQGHATKSAQFIAPDLFKLVASSHQWSRPALFLREQQQAAPERVLSISSHPRSGTCVPGAISGAAAEHHKALCQQHGLSRRQKRLFALQVGDYSYACISPVVQRPCGGSAGQPLSTSPPRSPSRQAGGWM
jgi:hypothetical protein